MKIPYKGFQHHFPIFLLWTAPKLMSTNLVNVLVFLSLFNSWSSYSRLISFRITCFNLNSRNTTLSRNTTKKSSVDQKPQSKVISIAKVQSNELLDVSCKPKSSKLWVYHITSKLVANLSHSELQANKLVNCKPASLRAPSLKVSNF